MRRARWFGSGPRRGRPAAGGLRGGSRLDQHRTMFYTRTEFDAISGLSMDITKDIRPLTEFKRDSARMIARIRETGRPQILTVNGKPAVVVVDAATWQELQDQLDHAEAAASIGRGLAQARAGEGVNAGAFFDGLVRTR